MTAKLLSVITGLLLLSFATRAQIDTTALAELVKACADTHSAGLAIWHDGKSYETYIFDTKGTRVKSYSAHKSLISLAIGKLITDGVLAGIDTPVYRFYPEWKQSLKKTITLRHLLNHTSALEYYDYDADGWAPDDAVQYALCASVVDTPGHYFLYSDRAVDLLRGIIKKASGQSMDKYIAEKLFSPMGITDYEWEYDKAGTPVNLVINPAEFVKLGQLMLDNGAWKGKQLISAAWIEQSLQQSQPFVPNCGLLWWRIPESVLYTVDDVLLQEFAAAGVSQEFIKKFEPLKGVYKNVNIPEAKLVAAFGENWNAVLEEQLYRHYPRRARWSFSDKYIGYKAEGWLGQYIIIYPEKNLVAYRMVKQGSQYVQGKDELRNFEQYVYKLVK